MNRSVSKEAGLVILGLSEAVDGISELSGEAKRAIKQQDTVGPDVNSDTDRDNSKVIVTGPDSIMTSTVLHEY